MANRITELDAATALQGTELLELSQRSATVAITATTISAIASDNSLNDSANGFTAAGFTAGDRVAAAGFGTAGNNLLVGTIETLTDGKMVISSPEGDAIVDEAEGASITIAKWNSRRATADDIAGLAGGDVAIEDDGTEILAAASRLNFTGAGVVVSDSGSGEAEIAIAGGGGGGSGGVGLPSTFAAFEHAVALNVGGGTGTTGAWTARTLAQVANSIAGASIAADQVTLPAGTYVVVGSQEFYRTSYSQVRVHNVDDDATLVQGQASFFNDSSDGSSIDCYGTFTLAAPKLVEFQYKVSAAPNSNSLGFADPNDPAVFATLLIERVADAGLGTTITEAGTATNLANSTAFQYQRWTATGAKTLTVQPDATEAIDQDAEFYIANRATSDNLTIAAGAGVTINAPSGGGLVLEPGMAATLKRVASDEFDLLGQSTT